MSMLSVNFQESDDAGIAIEDFDTLTPLAQDGCLLWMLARRHSGESLIIATGQSDDVTFQATQRLKNERALAAYLSPRWAITATGTTRYLNRYALIYPTFPFRSLANNLATPPDKIADFLQVALQLCYTLGQAHHQGIVHGDIKPGHFFYQRRGPVPAGRVWSRLAGGAVGGKKQPARLRRYAGLYVT